MGGETPVAALTAYARDEDRLRILRSGFQAYILKPVEPGDLIVAVAGLVRTVWNPPDTASIRPIRPSVEFQCHRYTTIVVPRDWPKRPAEGQKIRSTLNCAIAERFDFRSWTCIHIIDPIAVPDPGSRKSVQICWKEDCHDYSGRLLQPGNSGNWFHLPLLQDIAVQDRRPNDRHSDVSKSEGSSSGTS